MVEFRLTTLSKLLLLLNVTLGICLKRNELIFLHVISKVFISRQLWRSCYKISIRTALLICMLPSKFVWAVFIFAIPFILQPNFSKSARRSIKSQKRQEMVNSLIPFSFKVFTIVSTSCAHIMSSKLMSSVFAFLLFWYAKYSVRQMLSFSNSGQSFELSSSFAI